MTGDGSRAVGTVTVTDGDTVLATVELTEKDKGKVKVKLPKLDRGLHVLQATFEGDGYETSTSFKVPVLAY